MAELVLKDINKIYDNGAQAVFDFNLQIHDKEFIVFVGPSGCGKSTTLRMIAGLEDITTGDLLIDNKRMNNVEPKDRDIAMVFQSYALYPHMTVKENMSFGLKIAGIDKAEIEQRVAKAAKILEIEEYLERRPKQLSGGQRQRVALGRAIVRNAKVFLMDEPLSNLDAKLRVQMRSEIIKLHESIGGTTIYVTHDQTEAMTMATRIVVMRRGYIQQIGTPKDIYNNPANVFVATFVGSPATNILKGTVTGDSVTIEGFQIPLTEKQKQALASMDGKEVLVGIRPEHLTMIETGQFDFTVEISELLGHETLLNGKIGSQKLIAKISENETAESHNVYRFSMQSEKMYFFDVESEKRIV